MTPPHSFTHDIYRLAAAVPRLQLAEPMNNAREMLRLAKQAEAQGASLILFPELSLTGATCGDLFTHQSLLKATQEALQFLAVEGSKLKIGMLVGFPKQIGTHLYDCAGFPQNGDLQCAAFRQSAPRLRNDSSLRAFTLNAPQNDNFLPQTSWATLQAQHQRMRLGICFGEELQTSPGKMNDLLRQGCHAIANISATPDTLYSQQATRLLVQSASAQLKGAVLYVNAGFGESSASCVYGGQALIAINGQIVAEAPNFSRESTLIMADILPDWIDALRLRESGCPNDDSSSRAPILVSSLDIQDFTCSRHPFIPENSCECADACEKILTIQATGLARRVEQTHSQKLVLGLSGGLDSTLALLACQRCKELLKKPDDFILAITMPGMGTSSRTKNNAVEIARQLHTDLREISIQKAVLQHFEDIGHDPQNTNVVYENTQARERTQILMDIANELNGLVIGTGDLSEIALGWCTYSGDHIAMYGLNSDVPKTMIRAIIEHVACHSTPELATLLRDVIATPVSPELLPGSQCTEKIIGDYDLHDFFLYYFLTYGETPDNIFLLAQNAFKAIYPPEKIQSTLELFIKRFFTQQFKRNCATDAPKVYPLSLSPHSDWQMPSDVSFSTWK